ncbi:hypothetical protein HN014_02990 [Aquimarina sp. TRL1]|uniref:glycosyltransferase family 39 protein n=1 Tax=Aquimarina sp. (strain TRL1) TaxID=2736252 RepID=UPI00158853B5|nr:glycosyltransferase family 39 protein [Aquimarina sp. TRL1]QKX03913.1 hypothetical protein HN014_02990 [Aquimarina sp. TRL1]
MPLPILFTGVGIIVFFFLGVYAYNKSWKHQPHFKQSIFMHSLLYRLLGVLGMYWLTMLYDPANLPLEISASDSWNYHYSGVIVANAIHGGDDIFEQLSYFWKSEADYGFSILIGTLYSFLGKNILVIKIFNALIGAFTVVRIYQITAFAYDEKRARLAGVITMLMPPLLWFGGIFLKETVLIFLIVNTAYYTTKIINQSRFLLLYVLIILCHFGVVFYFRTILAPLLFCCVLMQLVFYKTKKKRYRFFSGLITAIFIAGSIYVVNTLSMDKHLEPLIEASKNQFGTELSTASKNRGITYAAALIAPLLIVGAIITPFPSVLDFEEAQLGIYAHYQNEIIRNSLYFFVFLGLYRAVKLRNRETIFILSFSIIYIVILAISGISFQDRFQILSLPFLIVFMSDGIIADHKRKKQQWILYLGFIFLAIFMWNVFKLSNRGLL